MLAAADRARIAQAVTKIFGLMRKYHLDLDELIHIGGDLNSPDPRIAEKARRVEKTWAAMARLGMKYADLEQAPGGRHELNVARVTFLKLLKTKGFLTLVPRETPIDFIEEFPFSGICAVAIMLTMKSAMWVDDLADRIAIALDDAARNRGNSIAIVDEIFEAIVTVLHKHPRFTGVALFDLELLLADIRRDAELALESYVPTDTAADPLAIADVITDAIIDAECGDQPEAA